MPSTYPKFKYHATQAPILVRTAEEEAALDPVEWRNSPADFPDKQYGFDLRDVDDTSIPLDVDATGNAEHLAYYVEWDANTTGGMLWVESAAYPTWAGKWAKVAEIPWTEGNKQDYFAIPGVHGATRIRVQESVQGGGKAQVFAQWK